MARSILMAALEMVKETPELVALSFAVGLNAAQICAEIRREVKSHTSRNVFTKSPLALRRILVEIQ